jgi:hypothetical protein
VTTESRGIEDVGGDGTRGVSGPFGRVASSWLGGWVVRLAPFVVFLGLAIALTYPFVVSPTSTVTAPIGYDLTGSIAKFHAVVAEGTTPFTADRLETMAWPNSYPTSPSLDQASFLSSGVLWLGTLAIGSIPAHGVFVVLGYFLTGWITYLFVRRLTGSVGAGLIAGLALGSFSHIRLLARAAPIYMHLWLYVLPVWRFTELVMRPSRRNALLAGASTIPAMFWTPYFTEHILVAAGACGVVSAVLLWRWNRTGGLLRTIGWTALPVVAAAAIYVSIGFLGEFADVPERDPRDLYVQSAHPLMYVLPGAFSIWGDWGQDLLVRTAPRGMGTNLYLGLPVLLLAGLGVHGLLVDSRRWRRSTRQEPSKRILVAGLLGVAVTSAAVAFSGPPTTRLLGLTLPTPAEFTTTLVPALRAGQRFVMLAMVGVAVLAGIGTARLLRPGQAGRNALLVCGIGAFILVDFSVSAPGGRVDHVPTSSALAALRGEPNGPTVHFGPGTLLAGATLRPCVFQPQHRKTLINSCNTSYFQPLLWELDDNQRCTGLERLYPLGVRYLVVDQELEIFPGCDRDRYLKPVSSDSDFEVLRVRLD